MSLFVRWHHLPRRGYAAPRLPDVTPSLRPFGPSRHVAGEGSFPWPLTASPPSRISLVFQLTKKMMMVDEGALRVSLLSVCLVLLDVGHKTIDRDDRKTDRPTDRPTDGVGKGRRQWRCGRDSNGATVDARRIGGTR